MGRGRCHRRALEYHEAPPAGGVQQQGEPPSAEKVHGESSGVVRTVEEDQSGAVAYNVLILGSGLSYRPLCTFDVFQDVITASDRRFEDRTQ
jgi:hypothetical protein